MKNINNTKHQQTNEATSALTNGYLLHLDGHCLTGRRGTLAVILQPASFLPVRQSAAPTQWLIPVDDPLLAQVAATLPGEVLWLCRRHPSEVLGQLDDGLRGAWLEDDAVVVNLDGQPRRFPLAVPPDAAFALQYLAWIVANVWTGMASAKSLPSAIQGSHNQPAALRAA